jgi:TRAP-type C4-dicarboxylate transport system permease small subunit
LPSAPSAAWLSRIGQFIARVEDALLLAILVFLIVLASSQIVLRNVFSIGLAWTDGTIRLAVLWLALLAAMAAARERRHIAIDVLTRNFPPLARRAASVATCLFTAGVMVLLAWYAWAFVADSREFGDVLVDNWPAWILQLIMPAGFAVIALRYLWHAASEAAGGR